jgi:hypothetical protein
MQNQAGLKISGWAGHSQEQPGKKTRRDSFSEGFQWRVSDLWGIWAHVKNSEIQTVPKPHG